LNWLAACQLLRCTPEIGIARSKSFAGKKKVLRNCHQLRTLRDPRQRVGNRYLSSYFRRFPLSPTQEPVLFVKPALVVSGCRFGGSRFFSQVHVNF
jgi:hypothetical protein